MRPHVRRIHRRRHSQGCQCQGVPKLLTAPGPPRLIPKSSLGVSVWTFVLLEKYLHVRPLTAPMFAKDGHA